MDSAVTIGERNIAQAMEQAPWGDFRGQKNLVNFVGLSLLRALNYRDRQTERRMCASLYHIVWNNKAFLAPDTCGTLALRILGIALKEFKYPQTSAKLLALAPSDPFLFHYRGRPYLSDELVEFIHALLEECEPPLSDEMTMSEVLAVFLSENKRSANRRVSPFFLHCLLKSPPAIPLLRAVRNVWVQTLTGEQSAWENRFLAMLRQRAETGLWRRGAEGEVGRAILLADIRTVWKKNFPLFLARFGNILGVPVMAYYPAVETDPLLQLRLHVHTINFASSESWALLPSLVARVANKTEQLLDCLNTTVDRLVEVREHPLSAKDEYENFEVAASALKSALYRILEQHFVVLAKKGSNRIAYILDRLDERDLLFPQDIAKLTEFFSKRPVTKRSKNFYHALVYPYLIRYHHPHEGLDQALLLLNRSVQDVFHCRDFLKIGIQEPYRFGQDLLSEMAVFFPGLNLRCYLPPNFSFAQALGRFDVVKSYYNFLVVLQQGILPENRGLMLKACAAFIQNSTQFIEEEGSNREGGTHTEFCRREARVCAISCAVMRFLLEILPAQPSLELDEAQLLKRSFLLFVYRAYPLISSRQVDFFKTLAALAEQVRWLGLGEEGPPFKFDFTPQEPHSMEEIEEVYALLQKMRLLGWSRLV